MNIIEFASKHLYPYKVKGNELVAEKCPYCGNRHKSKNKFFVNLDKQTFICFHGDCSKQGHFAELCKDFGEVFEVEEKYQVKTQPKEYTKPKIKTNELSEAAVNYAYKRKISASTLKAFNITQKDNNYVLPFYDENNELVFVKYRPIGKVADDQKKAFREKGGKPILFNMSNIDVSKPLVITEGEFDAMAIYEAGYKNVVSVPSGSKELGWIELCWDWLEKINKIIIFGDNDKPGQEMIEKIVQRLGEYKCYVALHDYKDANEVLFYQGAQAILNAIENPKSVPKEGLIDVADIDITTQRVKGAKLGFKGIDKLLNGARPGELTIWTGKNGEGKSTILSEVILESVEQDIKVFAYSGELTQRDFKEWLVAQTVGQENIKFKKNEYDSYDMEFDSKVVQRVNAWLQGKLFLYDNTIKTKNIENTSIIDLAKYAAKRFDCKVFVIDNLMTSDFDGSGEDFYRAQSKFVGELVHFAKSFNVHVHLVAHPNKTKDGSLEKENISGSGDITNRADNVIAIERNKTDDDSFDSRLRILKNRNRGALGEIKLVFSEKDKRLYELNADGTCYARQYSWNKFDEGLTEVFDPKCPWD